MGAKLATHGLLRTHDAKEGTTASTVGETDGSRELGFAVDLGEEGGRLRASGGDKGPAVRGKRGPPDSDLMGRRGRLGRLGSSDATVDNNDRLDGNKPTDGG